MNTKKLTSSIYFLIFFSVILVKAQSPGYIYTSFELLPQSKIELNGKTNINQFNCYTLKLVNNVNVLIKPNMAFVYKGFEKNLTSYSLKHAEVAIEVNMLECGQEVINKDMRKTLKAAEYPKILIDLKNIIIDQEANQSKNSISAEAIIAIAGVYKPACLKLKGSKSVNQNHYVIQGEHTIRLTDYGIDPPNTFFGLIKVRDEINIVFDLAFRQMEVTQSLEGFFSNPAESNW